MSNKEYRPTLAQLRTFVTIAEYKHFGTAASHLGISQPSLSQALVSLENGLGLQLIERSTRRVMVTPAGQELLPYAKKTLDAAESFLFHARGTQGTLAGPVTIGMIPTVAPYLLPDFLRLAKTRLPQTEPIIVEDKTKYLLESLRDGHIDCAIAALPISVSGITVDPLYDEPFHLVIPAGHPYAGRTNLTLSDIHALELDLLLLDEGHCLRDQVMDLCHQSDKPVVAAGRTMTRATSLPTVIHLVAGGLGATLVPASAVPFECGHPGLATASFSSSVRAQRTIAFLYRTSSSRAEDMGHLANVFRDVFTTVSSRLKNEI